MELFKSGNPTLNEKVFQNAGVASGQEVMTERAFNLVVAEFGHGRPPGEHPAL